MVNELRLEPVRKRMQKVEGNITKAFTEQTSLTPVEIMEAYHFSLGFTVHTISQTFNGMLTFSGRVKKKSINEETISNK